MKAAVLREYGSWDKLSLEEVPEPVPGDHDVLLRVEAVAINDWDWQILEGTSFLTRMGNGLRRPQTQILGLDVAGRVEAVGARVTRFEPGDEVYGDICGSWGGFAEYVCAPEAQLITKPSSLSFTDAAATSHAANLATQGLIDLGQISEGQTVLINGAGGGVGSFGIQIAKLHGAEVTGVDHGDKFELMQSLGYDHVLDYTREDFTRTGRRYDLILDAKTTRLPTAYLRALDPGGRYVTVGGDIGKLFAGVLVVGSLLSLAGSRKLRLLMLEPNKDLAYINDLYRSGRLRAVIDGPYPFADLPRQMRRFGEGEHLGKIVIDMSLQG